jgi:hypothetical protein
LIPDRGKGFSLLQIVLTGSGTVCPRRNMTRLHTDQLTLPSTEVNNGGAIPLLSHMASGHDACYAPKAYVQKNVIVCKRLFLKYG